ncbi:DUF2244 domain-containing protein [Herbaspirillum seropedicae]|nr:DUF2244 domain-containing protein [Herbaspirillum sp. alder98]
METREWILKRNCSIAPRRQAWVTAIFCTVSLTNLSAFFVQGAWTILIVTVAEMRCVRRCCCLHADTRGRSTNQILVIPGF